MRPRRDARLASSLQKSALLPYHPSIHEREAIVAYLKPEHEIIGELLAGMDAPFLAECQCYFGGGTAIVLKNNEYRRSLDVDFLCADMEGYRKLRVAFFDHGVAAVLPDGAKELRQVRTDQYGIRTFVEYQGQAIKFEIIRESRIPLSGNLDPDLGVPTLAIESMFAEKLLANADRCQDSSVAYRDAIDLGFLVLQKGEIPHAAVQTAEAAYGSLVSRSAAWVLNKLQDPDPIRYAVETLDMRLEEATAGLAALRDAARHTWPDADIRANSKHGKGFDF